MVVRKFVAALAVSSALVLGTTGCSLSRDIPTMQQYAPSDGTQTVVDGVKARNVIYLTDRVTDPNTPEIGGLIGSFVNTTDKPVTLRIQFSEDASNDSTVITKQNREWMSESIAPGQKYDLGYNENPALPALILQDNGKVAEPGDLVSVWIAVNDGTGVQLQVPALDGTLDQYKPMVQNLRVAAGLAVQ